MKIQGFIWKADSSLVLILLSKIGSTYAQYVHFFINSYASKDNLNKPNLKWKFIV